MKTYVGYASTAAGADLDTIAGQAAAAGPAITALTATVATNAATAAAATAAVATSVSVLEAALNAQPSGSRYLLIAASGPYVAGALELTGRAHVFTEYSGISGSTLTTRTAAQMIGDSSIPLGASFIVRLINSSGGTLTLVGGTGVTVGGLATVATNTWREFNVNVDGSAAMTWQSVGSGAL